MPKPTGQLTDMSKVPDSLRDRWHRARQGNQEPAAQARTALGQHTTIEQVEAALTAARGNVLYASEMLGITRTAVYRGSPRYPELQKLQAKLLEEELDDHEGALDVSGARRT